MPQMAPISWLSLFIIFSIVLILFSIMNYYTNIHSPKSKIIKKSLIKSMNWKW